MNNAVLLFSLGSFVFIFIIILIVILLLTKHLRLAIKYNRYSKYFYNYLNAITSARYGNLNLKIEDGIDALTIQLSRNTNALLESIKDRDEMITEYIEKDKQSQNLKQDFISSLAHDLKVPIIAQDNTYDLFLKGELGKITQKQREVIEILKISNNDLKNLIMDLLDVHKLERQELDVTLKNTNVKELIEEVISQQQSILTIQDKNIIFETKEDIIYPLDSFLFKRVLNNLISNAIFYSKESKDITIKTKKTSKNLEISVIDKGVGINEKDLNNIFTKYYTSAKKYSNIGVGLGLYIANKIIIAHKGKLKAKNNPDKGTCFTIKLPLV